MKIIEYSGGVAVPTQGPLALALGFFDGMHLAHRRLIARTVELAKEKGLTPAVFTFPTECAGIKSQSPRIYTSEQKLGIMEELGIEVVILADFASVCSLDPVDFVTRVLVCDLNCAFALCGYNFRFAKGAAADAPMLLELMHSLGRGGEILDKQTLAGDSLSATAIRELLAEGRVAEAREALGAPYFIEGCVQHGRGVGRHYGFPTVNLPLPEGCPIKRGVYLSATVIDGKGFVCLTNVGSCPTFDVREMHTETTLLDFDGDLYGRTIRIHFFDFIRDEIKFQSPEELGARIERDRALARQKGGLIKWQEIGLK